MKLTGTNNSIGLIVRIACIHLKSAHAPKELRGRAGQPAARSRVLGLRPDGMAQTTASRFEHALCRPGGYGGAAAPDPIPNSAVKRSSADGTSSQDAGE